MTLQFTFDPKTGAPTSDARPSAEKAAAADTPPIPAEKSEFERSLEATIQDNVAVQWLREHPLIYHASAAGSTLVVAIMLYVALRAAVFLPLLRFISGRGDTTDGPTRRGAQLVLAIRDSKLVNPLAWILPFFVAWRGIALWPGLIPALAELFGRTMLGIAIVFCLIAISRLLDAIDILVSLRLKRPGALRGYVQAISAVVYVVGGITIIAIFLGRSPVFFLTGVGAFAAVLAVVLKDTLLSMYANILMTTGDTLRVGDWIEMRQHAVDGRVEAIRLTSTKVRNWDETTLTIPNYRFVSEVFVNYRTNDPRGGRRLRRTLRMDQRTVRRLREDELVAAARVLALARAVEAANHAASANGAIVTNLALYRAYVEQYLMQHPKVDSLRPLVVRQNEPTSNGVPIDVLAFFFDCELKEYEALQAAILDHFMAVSGVFGLRSYQMGSDLAVARETFEFLPSPDLQLLDRES